MNKISSWINNVWSYMGWDDFLAVSFFVLGVLGYAEWITKIPGGNIVLDLRAEFIGIGITVFIIGNTTDARNRAAKRDAEKARLIFQMGSPDNNLAIEAVRQLRKRGWLEDGSLKNAYLSNAYLSNVNLSGADLRDSFLIGANLSGAQLFGANLSGTHLFGANLNGATLASAILKEADLSGTDLRAADLEGVNLDGANLRGARLNGARYDGETIWPTDFNPKVSGARLIE